MLTTMMMLAMIIGDDIFGDTDDGGNDDVFDRNTGEIVFDGNTGGGHFYFPT